MRAISFSCKNQEAYLNSEGKNPRPVGEILVDGGFISAELLSVALEEQTRTNKLLCEILVSMNILESADMDVVLSIQKHLDQPKSALKLAAGVRETIGALLLQSGRISAEQLDMALAEQKRTGGKLGEILLRFNMLTEQQLNYLLDFQQFQSDKSKETPALRLGEILVSMGCITREQLTKALLRQRDYPKKIGEILVEEGHVKYFQIHRGLGIQRMLITSVLVALVSFGQLSGCGGGAEDGHSARTPTAVQTVAMNSAPLPIQDVTPVELDISLFTTKTSDGMRLIRIPQGTYTISNTIVLDSDTIFEGNGDGTIIITEASFAGSRLITNSDPVHGNRNIIVRNLAIQHESSQFMGESPGLMRFENVEHLEITDVTMQVDSPLYGIDLSAQISNATISGSKITNKGSGGCIMVRNAAPLPDRIVSGVLLLKNRVESVIDEPIAVFGWQGITSDVRIENNTVLADGASFGISVYGIDTVGHSGKISCVEIIGNTVSGGRVGGIGVKGGAHKINIAGNLIEKTEGDGIFLHAGGEGLPEVQDIQVNQNEIRNAGRHGIFIAGSNITVENNQISTCALSGVYAAGIVSVIANVITNASPCILLDGGQESSLRGNILSNDGRILILNKDGSVYKNMITGS